jgi:hypothetical protein
MIEAFCIHIANNLIQFLLALLTSNLKKSPSLSLFEPAPRESRPRLAAGLLG